jgi:hypothetical protein
MVSGDSLWEDIVDFFTKGGNSEKATMLQVFVSGTSYADVKDFTYDIERVRTKLPDCSITVIYTPSTVSENVNVSANATSPTVGGGVTVAKAINAWTYTCPPKSGIPQFPSN